MVLRVVPTGIDDAVGIRRGVDGTIRDAIVDAIVTVIIDPIPEAVGPVSACAGVTDSSLRRRCSSRCRGRAVLVRFSARVYNDLVVVRIVGGGMIEDGFL